MRPRESWMGLSRLGLVCGLLLLSLATLLFLPAAASGLSVSGLSVTGSSGSALSPGQVPVQEQVQEQALEQMQVQVVGMECPPLVFNRPTTCRLILHNNNNNKEILENGGFWVAVTVPPPQVNKLGIEAYPPAAPGEETTVWQLLPGATLQIDVPLTPTKAEWVYQAFDIWVAPVIEAMAEEGEEETVEETVEEERDRNSALLPEWQFSRRLYMQQRVWQKLAAVYVDTAHGNYGEYSVNSGTSDPVAASLPTYFTTLQQEGLEIVASAEPWVKGWPAYGVVWAELSPEASRHFQTEELAAAAGWVARGGNLIISVKGLVQTPETGFSAGVSFALEGINRLLVGLGSGNRFIPLSIPLERGTKAATAAEEEAATAEEEVVVATAEEEEATAAGVEAEAGVEEGEGLIAAIPPLRADSEGKEYQFRPLFLENPVALLGAGVDTVILQRAGSRRWASPEKGPISIAGEPMPGGSSESAGAIAENAEILATMEQIGRGRLVLLGANPLAARGLEADEYRENVLFIAAMLHWLAEQGLAR